MTEEILNALPQVASDQGAFISNGATGTATVDLRGLGAARTLVLVNGRRLMPGDPFDPVPDINAVPTALIKRVEVLTGGATSVYGSDAVAGVVNFILETRLEGLRVEGQAGVFQHDNRDGLALRQALVRAGISFPNGSTVDGGRQDINAAYGASFAHSRGHATVYAGYRKLSKVTEDARDYSACTTKGRLDSNIFDCGGSEASATGTFYTNFDGPFQVGSGREFVEGVTLFNFAPFNFYQRPDRRYTAGAFADFEISRAAKPFLELMFMDDHTTAQIAPSAAFGDVKNINCDNPLLSGQQRAQICFHGNFVGEAPVLDEDGNLVGIEGTPVPFVDPVTGATYFRGVLLPLRRNVEGGPRTSNLRHKDLRLLTGIRGELGRGISYEASALFGQVRYKNSGSNDLSISKTRRALDVIRDPVSREPACRSALTGEDPSCVPWDIFAPGAVTPEATSYLAILSTRHGKVEQRVATAFANVSLEEWGIRSPWADDGPTLNLGGEYRKDKLSYEPDAIAASADIAGADPEAPVSGATDVKELFGEARIPLVTHRAINSLVLEVGYRQSWQSNSENSFRVSSYKLGMELAPVRDIRLRASLERAVRAPNVQELFAPIIPGGFRRDPCAGVVPIATAEQCARTGVPQSLYGHIVPNPLVNAGVPYNAFFGGNPALEPEHATTKAVGLVLHPRFIPGMNATVDWYDIKLNDTIRIIGSTAIMNTCIETGDPFFCRRIHRDANGSLWMTPGGFIDNRNANIGSIKVRGIDVGFDYVRSIGRFGSLEVEFLGTRLDRLTYDNGGLSSPFECAGAYGIGCGVPKPNWRHKARATWNLRLPLSFSFQWRHFGSVDLDRSIPGNQGIFGPWRPGDEKIGTQNYYDLTASARISDKYELRLGIRNIFDREPPIVSNPDDLLDGVCAPPGCNGNTFPETYDPLGRYLFAGVTADF
jgi:outer membrane receptor protein involved in Fe transport